MCVQRVLDPRQASRPVPEIILPLPVARVPRRLWSSNTYMLKSVTAASSRRSLARARAFRRSRRSRSEEAPDPHRPRRVRAGPPASDTSLRHWRAGLSENGGGQEGRQIELRGNDGSGTSPSQAEGDRESKRHTQRQRDEWSKL